MATELTGDQEGRWSAMLPIFWAIWARPHNLPSPILNASWATITGLLAATFERLSTRSRCRDESSAIHYNSCSVDGDCDSLEEELAKK